MFGAWSAACYKGQPGVLICGCPTCSPPVRKSPQQDSERDGNGSLLCSQCREPYPYANPPAVGKFRCASCRSYDQLIE